MQYQAKQIACSRNGRLIFHSLSFLLAPKTMLSVRGENGAGKTSLLHILANLIQPYDGKVYNFVPQNTHFIPLQEAAHSPLTLHKQLCFWGKVLGNGKPPSKKIYERLGLVPLLSERVCHLSAGEQKRLQLARLLHVPRNIWLLDEPCASLDEAGQSVLKTMLGEHCEKGGIAIMTTHAHSIGFGEEIILKGGL